MDGKAEHGASFLKSSYLCYKAPTFIVAHYCYIQILYQSVVDHTLTMDGVRSTSVCVLWLFVLGLAASGHWVRAYTLPQREQLLSEMISDLRQAYHEQRHNFNKRLSELESTIEDLKTTDLSRE